MDGKPTQSPYIIALCQQKGGVGKTTTAACLGAGLAQSGKNVLLLDLAPSGNLTASFGINLNRVKRSTTDLFQGTYPPTSLIKPTMIKGLNLIPAQTSLTALSKDLQQKQNSEQRLQDILAGDGIPDYDIIILDCPPGLTLLSVNALACANLAILPVICEYFSLQTLESMHRMIKNAQEKFNAKLTYRLLISRLDQRAKLHKRVHAQIEEHNRSLLLKTVIGSDIKLPESQLAGIPISLYAPNSRATRQFQSLTQEILNIIN
ncbi:ParA family protein [Chloroflexota bacterium]|nr:ParA family protein [Chloroflexota bacterium]